MTVSESRRLTGPSLVLDRPGRRARDPSRRGRGGERADRALARRRRGRLLDAVGWEDESLAVRRFTGGASLALTAPIDALYAAVDLNEAAWAEGRRGLDGRSPPRQMPSRAAAPGHRGRAAPARSSPCATPRARGTSPSSRARSRCRSARAPARWSGPRTRSPRRRAWTGRACTTSRSRSSPDPMARPPWCACWRRCSRRRAARSASPRPMASIVGDTLLGEGDFSGPSGARLLLRRPEVEAAVLETARGGLLRRGLTVDRARWRS